MKIIVYTCNIGHYDLFRNIFPKPNNKIKYIYFTDEDEDPVNGWEVVKVDKSLTDNKRKLARYYKINSHKVLPEHDISLWIDARFIINEDAMNNFILKYKKYDISCFPYPWADNDCLYQEAIGCAKNGMTCSDIIADQVGRYSKDGYPKHNGLFATGIIIRKNNAVIDRFNEAWWYEVDNYSLRDQISQCYVAWKQNLEINPITDERNVYENPIAKVWKHRIKRKDDIKRLNNIKHD